MAVLVLDWILDRDDVPLVAAVDLVHERGERRRLARPCGTADQHETARQVGELRDGGRKAQGRQQRHLRGQGADRSGGTSSLAVEVDTESAETGDTERSV